MRAKKQNRVMQAFKINHGQSGFTVLEVMVTVAVVSVIAGVVIPAVYHEYERARLASCFSELNGMKAVAYDLGNGRYIPTPEQFWNEGFPSAGEGEYYYIVDAEDANKGHGNDLDNCDEDNPGASLANRTCLSMKFAVFCTHNHGSLGRYCYATDVDPPTAVTGDDDDPGYHDQLGLDQGEDPPPVGKEPKTRKK